jgi:hypothetical protein
MKAMARRNLPELILALSRRWHSLISFAQNGPYAHESERRSSKHRGIRLSCAAPQILRQPTSIGLRAFDAVFKHPTGLSVDTDFVYHMTFLNIEGIA